MGPIITEKSLNSRFIITKFIITKFSILHVSRMVIIQISDLYNKLDVCV